MKEKNKGELVLYQTSDGKTKLEVSLENETVWLNQEQLAKLFGRDKSVISKHIKEALKDGEINSDSSIANFATELKKYDPRTGKDRLSNVMIKYYNLDVIISVGYRVKSLEGVRFRKWATERIKEYIIKGFTIDDEKLKNLGGGTYWHELINRIKDIRSSEKVLYRQVLDLYATALDYNPSCEETIQFFKIVQNKFHYAVSGHTAAEIVYERADANKPFMGLTNFKGELPGINDIQIAKNYLTEDELTMLNNLVSGYFDFAEFQAMQHKPMYMKDYLKQLDSILKSIDAKILDNSGKVSHDNAMNKAENEYRKYEVREYNNIEKDYLKSINELNTISKEISKKDK